MPPKDRTKRRVLPSQERAHASSDAILLATEQLLREQGFARTTTNRIAARAGVNVALLYRYFAGKEAIVGALIERVARATYEAVQRVLGETAQTPLPTVMRALVDELVRTPVDPVVHRELVEHVEVTKRRQVVTDLRAQLAMLFAGVLVERRNELRPLPDPEATLFVLQHALEAASHAAAFYRPETLELPRVLDALTEVVTRALLPVHDPLPVDPRTASAPATGRESTT